MAQPLIRRRKELLQYYLRDYRKQSAAVYQKAWIQLSLLIVSACLLPFFMLNNYLARGSLEPALGVFLGAGFLIIAGLTFVLRSGRYLLSGHIFLALIFGLIWREMFFGFASAPLTRLDTIVLISTTLLMAPLLTNKAGVLPHFVANLCVLGLFIAWNPANPLLMPGELQAYAADAVVSMCVAAGAAYLLTGTAERGRKRIETSNANLEEAVRLRTNTLRRANGELRASRNALHRDILIARNVQKSALFRDPPAVADWDIAHYYRPMAQVSGDFYDFQADEKNLRGVSLFDVSGHGIASGLITMLAHSIIQRGFHEPKSAHLTDILSIANDELIANMQNTMHYISGVFLRFQGDELEYANAGHPDVLMKPRDGEAAAMLEPDDGSLRGGLLGLDYFRDNYPITRRAVRPGDALLLFSDGITEAETSDESIFGVERLRLALNESTGTAHERLQQIVREHTRFMRFQPCQDDVTMILLVKKSLERPNQTA